MSKRILEKIKYWLSKLSFRTGVIVLAMYVTCIVIAFFPIIPWIKEWSIFASMSPYVKGLWWTAGYGIAHVFKYAGFTILGIEGYKHLKAKIKIWRNKKRNTTKRIPPKSTIS